MPPMLSIATDFISEVLIKIALFFDSLIYRLISYAYNLFLLVCKLNFGFLYDIVSPLVDRVRALIMVFIVFKLALMIIKFMMNPDEAPAASKKTLLNILKVAALLISYNLIFNFMDDVGMILLGAPEGYQYKVLSRFIDVDRGKDDGIISRLIFGTNTNIEDVGDFIAFNTLCVFIPDSEDPNARGTANSNKGKSRCTELESVIASDGKNLDMGKLPKISSKVGKTVDYWCVIDGIVGIYLIICIVQASVKVGIRMFKLMALQMVAPIAIISMIDEKTSKMDKFVSTYISVYLEVFLRVGSMLITTVFISKFITNIKEFFSDKSASGMTEGLLIIIVIVAAFKFVNDLPKFLEESLGVKIKGDGVGFGSFLKTLAGGAIGLGTGIAASAMGGNGVGRSLMDGARGMVNGAQAGNKSQGIADFFKKQAANTENIGKSSRRHWVEGHTDEDGNWVDGYYARPSMWENIRDKSGFGQAYRNRVERDQHEEINAAQREQAEQDKATDGKIADAQKDLKAVQNQNEQNAETREKERIDLQRKMSDDQYNLKETMDNKVTQERDNIKTQENAMKEQQNIEKQILDKMDSSSKYRNADGTDMKYGASAADFASRAVANDKHVLAANSNISRIEGELATGQAHVKLNADEITAKRGELSEAQTVRDKAATRITELEGQIKSGSLSEAKLAKAREELSATITHRNDLDARITTLNNEIQSGYSETTVQLTEEQKVERRQQLRQEIENRDILTTQITTEATQEFVNKYNSVATVEGKSTYDDTQRAISDARSSIEQSQQNIVKAKEDYESGKVQLELDNQVKTSEMAQRHREAAIQDRADAAKAQAALDEQNKAKETHKKEFERLKTEADSRAAYRLDGRHRRRPRIPRGGYPPGGNP